MKTIQKLFIQQREALAKHKADISELQYRIYELEQLIRINKQDAVTPDDVISEALQEAGIESYYFHYGNSKDTKDTSTRLIAIDGITCEVTVDLNTGALFINGNPINHNVLA